MIRRKQQLSLIYWGYSLAVFIALSKLGTLFFRLTKDFGQTHMTSRLGKLWWHFYLLNFGMYYKKEELCETNKNVIAVHWLQQYQFKFYNAHFHNSVMAHVLFEASRGNIPVICDPYGIWNSFFHQPFGDKDVIPNCHSEIRDNMCVPRFAPYNKTTSRIWQKIFRDFTIPNVELEKYVDQECAQIFAKTDRVLGVLCRGTDYVSTKPRNHPRQPELGDIITKCRKWMKKYGYEAIYLATEEKSIVERFEQEFPGKILTNKRTYYDEKMKELNLHFITEVHFDRENDDYYKGLEYLSSLYILSRCRALVAGNCGGTGITFLLNDDRYENVHIFDRGLY